MAKFIYFRKISTNLLDKQTNNNDQRAIIRWPIVATLKTNVAQGKFILKFAVILIKQCRDKQWQQYQ